MIISFLVTKINQKTNLTFTTLNYHFKTNLIFNSFEIKNYFPHKHPISNDLKTFLGYKFTCATCTSSYICETCLHFKNRIEEYIKKDNKSDIYKNLQSTATCFDSCNSLCFKIIDKAKSRLGLKIKVALHINWRKRNLNAQQNHLALTFYSSFCSPCFFLFLFVFLVFSFAFLFYLLFSLSLR